MNEIEPQLRRYGRRVRLMRAYRGLAVGLCFGGLAAMVWAVLDLARIAYTDWRGLGLLALAGLVVGTLVGLVLPTDPASLAASIDRRANLKDRLTTAMETPPTDSTFTGVQAQDAAESVAELKPSKLYPVRFGHWQWAGLIALVLPACVFLLGNSPAVRGPKSQAERAELKEMGQKVERVASPLEKPVGAITVPDGQKKLGAEMNRFAKELQEGRLNKEEALRKANNLAEKAEDEAKTRADEARKKTEEAETALGKFQKMKLDEAGIAAEEFEKTNLSPSEQLALEQVMKDQGFQSPKSKFTDKERGVTGVSQTAEKLAQLSPEQQEQLRQAVAKRQAEIQKEIDRVDKLPEAERKKLEQERAELQKQMQEMQKVSDALKLSEETKRALRELMNSEEAKKLREALQKMHQKSQQMSQQGKPMTKEEMEQLQQQIEELAQALKDPKLREQVLKQMQEALKQLESGQMSAEGMQSMMQSMGLTPDQSGGGDPNGDPSIGSDNNFADTGKVNKSEHEMETKGKGTPTRVAGQWNDKKGDQWSVTIKAPTQVGNRSSVPYQNVLPSYRKSAEKALSSGKIPREKEKRVKEYFDSLSGGKR